MKLDAFLSACVAKWAIGEGGAAAAAVCFVFVPDVIVNPILDSLFFSFSLFVCGIRIRIRIRAVPAGEDSLFARFVGEVLDPLMKYDVSERMSARDAVAKLAEMKTAPVPDVPKGKENAKDE